MIWDTQEILHSKDLETFIFRHLLGPLPVVIGNIFMLQHLNSQNDRCYLFLCRLEILEENKVHI